MDLLKQLAILLGLGEDATEEQVVNACGTAAADQKKFKEQTDAAAAAGEPVANKTVLGLLGLKDDAKTEDVTAAIVALSSKMPEGTVSAAEFKALKDKIAQRDADDTVTTALKTGKLTPAQKDWATEYALKDPAGFASFVEKAPQGVPMGELDMETKVNKEETVDDATLSVCKQLGVTKEDLAKFNKTE